MGRIVYAEERLLKYLEPLGGADAYSFGLILGQSTEQKDFVVHLTRTLPASPVDVVEEQAGSFGNNTSHDTTYNYIKSIKEIDINLVVDHAKHVTRMLPGGMWVLGIFVVGPGDCLSDNNSIQKLKLTLSAVYKNLASNAYLYGNSKYENLILSFNSITKKYTCKSIDTSTDGILKPAEWKFQKTPTKWHQLQALVDLNKLFPISDEDNLHTLKKQLQNIVKKITEIINSAIIVIENEPRLPEEPLETIENKSKSKKTTDENEDVDKIMHVGVYLPCPPKQNQENAKIIIGGASMSLMGQLVSRTTVHQNATIEEATNAVKQDILRSLASRLELHWESVIEEENGSPEENITMHEPPRRVFVELPQSKINLSDYLFPSEGPQESLLLLKELLDLDVTENQVQKDIERQVDPSEFYSQNEVKNDPVDSVKENTSIINLVIFVGGTVVALIATLIAFLLYYYNNSH